MLHLCGGTGGAGRLVATAGCCGTSYFSSTTSCRYSQCSIGIGETQVERWSGLKNAATGSSAAGTDGLEVVDIEGFVVAAWMRAGTGVGKSGAL